ncbi:glycosyl transferase family 2 [Lacticaseibacillus casei]|uniref:Glycosyltransferase family 2 protein n=1 Tax=Lacticaseibacillus zeae TaxID=57037 RepID=A0A5R8M1X6_LACZE|nr:glycosyltransferase family 2 protein [Lacticaseibacillus zeae]OLS09113.1 glycosyl transferase family 2 [Lacticaseibacillus casei]QVI32991.1 glycosyltransferase family 2 protein [Lacticaseibacillus zeae]TLF43525.1 glycosyltransferase family 2 protein [Lacticaseibacillus zeae]
MAAHEALISVIMPVYNAEKYLAQALDSLLAQDYSNFEILCVDDGSVDTSKIILAAYARQNARLHVIRVKNGGQARARQVGIEHAKGSFLAFMDSDDLVHPQWLSTMAEGMQTPRVDMTVVNYYNYIGGTKIKARSFHAPVFTIEGDDKYRYWLEDHDLRGYLWNKMFRADLFKEPVPVANFNLLEDAYFIGQLLPRIDQIHFVDQPRYYYRFNATSSVHAKFQKRDLEAIHQLGAVFLTLAREKPELTSLAVRRYAALSLFVLSKMSPRQLVANWGYAQQLGMVLAQYAREFQGIISAGDANALAADKPGKASLLGKLRAWSHLLGLPTFDDLNKLAGRESDEPKKES